MLKPPRRILDDLNHDDIVGGEGGGGGVGAWQVFALDPGWGWSTSTLRFRTVPAGLQFDGALIGSPGQGIFTPVGTLPPAYHPARQTVLMCATIVGNGFGWGFIVFQQTGAVATWWADAGQQMVVSGIVPLD